MRYIAPSILSADFLHLEKDIELVNEYADIIHVDVMDGSFVPNISFGAPVMKCLTGRTGLPFDVHLMIEHPESQIDSFIEAGADWITFHYEATNHSDLCIQKIHKAGKKAGISICPSTPVTVLEEVLPYVDLVLVMSVNPGWGGQKLIPYCVDKIKKLADIRKERNLNYLISVDGGVNKTTLPMVLDAGADVVVSGSSFFKGELDWKK